MLLHGLTVLLYVAKEFGENVPLTCVEMLPYHSFLYYFLLAFLYQSSMHEAKVGIKI